MSRRLGFLKKDHHAYSSRAAVYPNDIRLCRIFFRGPQFSCTYNTLISSSFPSETDMFAVFPGRTSLLVAY